MNLVMKLVSLGHAARNQSGIKVRQPLMEAAFATSKPAERDVIESYSDLLMDELNVKQVRVLRAASEATAYELVPLPKQLGQKYKNNFPMIKDAILELDPDEYAASLIKGEAIQILVEGKLVEILPDEIELRMQAKAGFVVASEGAYLAAIVTDISPELRDEGLSRELVRRVQDARKQSGFDISDRIRIFYTASAGLENAISVHKDYIMMETLAVEMANDKNPNTLPNASEEFDGEMLAIWLEKE